MEPYKKKRLSLLPLEKRLMLDASLPITVGQVLWLDAADATTIRDADGDNASTGTGGANNGFSGSVATWVDKSASGYNVTNGTAGEQPLYASNTLNGRNLITFDGSNDKLTNPGATLVGDDYTVFIVFNRTTGVGRDALMEIGSGTQRNGIFMNDGAGPNQINYYMNGSFYNYSGTYTTGTYTLLSLVQNGTAATGWRNAVSGLGAATALRDDTVGLFIGDDSTSGDQLQGNIAEIIVYNRDLTAEEVHDVENYLGSKWGLTITNSTPYVDTNTGMTLLQGTSANVQSLYLVAADTDNSDTTIIYTLTDLPDHGYLFNSNTGLTLGLGDTFVQGDISSNYIRYYNDGTPNFSDSFSFTLNDQYSTSAAATFNLTITPSNQAPVLQGWTQAYSENFEGGATGWNDNTTTTSNPYLTQFLGRHSMEGGAQNTYKTYALTGTQDYTVMYFDFYEIDSWDGESFRVFINDVMVYNGAFSAGTFNTPADGSSGAVSWRVQELTQINANFALGTWSDQSYRFTMTINNAAAGSLKVGFSSTLDQGVTDEAWGVDNIRIHEVDGGGVPGPMQIAENSANGTVVGTVTAVDPDVADTLSYSIIGGTGAGVFSINALSGNITVSNSTLLNYEVTTSYTLIVQVTDNGTPIRSDSETITINVIDIPENTAPVIPATGPFSVAENAAVNTVVGTVTATDAESNTITYSITAGNASGIFAINSATGAIRIANTTNLNYESATNYTLTIAATDNGFGNLSSTRNVTINITNVNEAPTFSPVQSVLYMDPTVVYNAGTGNFYKYISTTANYVSAQTAAAGALLNGIGGHLVTVSSAAENTFVRSLSTATIWLDGNDVGVEGEWRFGSGPNSGQMFWLGGAAGSVQGGFYANWQASQPDNGGGNEDGLQMLASGQWNDIPVTNSYAYVIEWEGTTVMAGLQNGPYSIAENSALGTSVGFANARDPDIPDTRTFSITGGTGSGLFAINSSTGEITLTGALNYEAGSSYTLNLRVQDAGGLFDTTTVTINVTDVNETPNLNPAGPFNYNENVAAGTVITTMTATDPDTAQTLTYSITGGNAQGIFAINGATGQLRFNTSPNYEYAGSHTLTIRVTDNGTGALFDQETVVVTINDLNESPSFDPIQGVLNTDPTLRYSAATGNFYRYVTTGANLATATANSSAAMLMGQAGHLVQVDSAAENSFLTSFIQNVVWIDGSDSAVEGEWRYTGGPKAGQMFWLGAAAGTPQGGFYSNWSGGEPNNSGNEDGIQLRTNGTWNDIATTGSFAYVIEWEGAALIAALQNGPYTIAENSAAGTSVGFVHSSDPDLGDTRTYSITGGSGVGNFAINTSTGEITLTGAVNYEATSSYTLNLRVQDTAGLFDTVTVTINVQDVNETPNLNPAGPFNFNENVAAATLITTMSATDPDIGQTLTYTIQSGNDLGTFALNSATGALTFARAPDFELAGSYSLVIRVTDNGTGALFDQETVTITINDLNETPSFDPVQGVLNSDPTLRYNATTGSFYRFVTPPTSLAVAQAAAAAAIVGGQAGHLVQIDNAFENSYIASQIAGTIWLGITDTAVEGEWRYVDGPNAGQMLWLSTSTGSAQGGFFSNWGGGEPNDFGGGEDYAQMFTSGVWNDISGGSYGYVIEWEGAALIAALQNGPYTIQENVAPGTSVGFAYASDPDAGDVKTFSITGGSGLGLFAINSATGEITVTGAINYEVSSSYTLNLRVQDVGGLMDNITVTINVTDINEAPILAAAGPFNFDENIAAGTAVVTMSAADEDAAQTLTYTIQSGNTAGMFSINAATGAITFAGSPDYETVTGYNLVIRVTDNGAGFLYDEQTVSIAINDLNEVPVLNPAGPFTVNENIAAGTLLTTMVATDQDAGQTLTYTIQSGNTGGMFAINAATGALTFAGSPNFELVNAYSLVIRVTDNGLGALYAEQTIVVSINDINDAPHDITLTFDRITENSPIGTSVGFFAAFDEDVLDTHSFSIVSNPFNKFVLVGNELRSLNEIDFELNQTFSIVIRADDGNGGLYDETFTIYVNDVMDTFTPPPASNPPVTVQPQAPPEEGDIRSASLLRASLTGGESGQALAFYGLGDVHQILRENMTFELRELLGDLPESAMMEHGLIGDVAATIVEDAGDDAYSDMPDRFTNLRQALAFFEQMQSLEAGEEEAEEPGNVKAVEAAREQTLPENTINYQFVDVLTYHEQRQARLREALLGKAS